MRYNTAIKKKKEWMDMEIRKLRENDYDTVSQFMAQLHKLHAERRPDMYRQLEEIGTVYTKEEFCSMLQNDEMITLGAETEEGSLMGICIATIREAKHPIMVPKKTVYIEDIYVSEKYRKQGVGVRLYQTVEKLARESGAEWQRIWVWSFLEAALRFYEKAGKKPQRWLMEKILSK